MSAELRDRKLSEQEKEAITRLEPAFPPRTAGVRAIAYGQALSDEHLEIKEHVGKCLQK